MLGWHVPLLLVLAASALIGVAPRPAAGAATAAAAAGAELPAQGGDDAGWSSSAGGDRLQAEAARLAAPGVVLWDFAHVSQPPPAARRRRLLRQMTRPVGRTLVEVAATDGASVQRSHIRSRIAILTVFFPPQPHQKVIHAGPAVIPEFVLESFTNKYRCALGVWESHSGTVARDVCAHGQGGRTSVLLPRRPREGRESTSPEATRMGMGGSVGERLPMCVQRVPTGLRSTHAFT